MISVEDWAEIRRLHRAEGLPIKQIARVMEVSRNTVRAAVRSDGPPEIEYRTVRMLAAALARCIDDAHAKAQNLPADRELEEAAQVRTSARQLLTDMVPHVAALMERDPGHVAVRPRGEHEPYGHR